MMKKTSFNRMLESSCRMVPCTDIPSNKKAFTNKPIHLGPCNQRARGSAFLRELFKEDMSKWLLTSKQIPLCLQTNNG